jgi:hypothetical protein
MSTRNTKSNNTSSKIARTGALNKITSSSSSNEKRQLPKMQNITTQKLKIRL